MSRPPFRQFHRLLAAVPVTLVVSCGTLNAAALPEPVPPGAPVVHPAPQTPLPTPASSPAPAEKRAPDPLQVDLLAAASAVAPGVTVGALVMDRRTGEPVLAVHADRQFRSASLVKLLIAIDALENGVAGPDGNTGPPTDEDRARLVTMLAASDDAIASSYWVRGGFSDIVVRMRDRLGLTATEPPEERGRWGEVRLSATDVARVYAHILAMPPADRELVVDALGQAPRHAADGFYQHFGIPDGISATWAVKQGWGDNSSAMVLHSTGLVGEDRRHVVVLLTEHPLGTDWGTARDSVTAAASVLGALPDLDENHY